MRRVCAAVPVAAWLFASQMTLAATLPAYQLSLRQFSHSRQDLEVSIGLKNVSQRSLIVPLTLSAGFDYVFQLFRNGKLLEKTASGKLWTFEDGPPVVDQRGTVSIRPSLSGLVRELAEGQSIGETIDLRKIHDLRPGKYQLTVKGRLPVTIGDMQPVSRPLEIVVL